MNDIQKRITAARRKKERIKISNLADFKNALIKEEYLTNEFAEENLKKEVQKIFGLSNSVIDNLYKRLQQEDIKYRANNVTEFIDYMEKIMVFEDEQNRLCEKISSIKILEIDRVEYDRIMSVQDNVEEILKDIAGLSDSIAVRMNEEEKINLENLEKEIDEGYVYAKDIELLKKMVVTKEAELEEKYNEDTKTRTIKIKIPQEINSEYIKAKKGSVEYYEHLTNNIPRMQRLINNLNRYIEIDEEEKDKVRINQSETLQDSINIAVAVFDGLKFKAISGSDEIENYCMAPARDKAVFKSSKVNKLGKLGIGYDRINDSEKKIFEAIHQKIQAKEVKDYGKLTLYSKWEPCQSCYFVISQFIKRYPEIDVQIKYLKRYGEK